MKVESLKEVFLDRARDIYLFDCRVAGLDSEALSAYSIVLTSFIHFTGNILVGDLTPEHVRLYIDNLSDGSSEGQEHAQLAISYYAVIHEWVRWLYAQKFLTERTSSFVKAPHSLLRSVMYSRQKHAAMPVAA